MICKEDGLPGDGLVIVCKDMAGVVPIEIQVIPHGFHKTPKGDFLNDDEAQQRVVENFKTQVNDMVIDFEHQTLYGKEAPAAGWIKELVNKGKDGLWAVVEWTEKAKEYIANKEYRYVSPVFTVDTEKRNVQHLINVALTNQPNIDGMVPLVNKKEIKKDNKEENMLEKILAALGLKKDAGEDAVMALVNKLMGGGEVMANKGLLENLGLKEGASAEDIIAGVAGLKGGTTVVANKTVLEALGLKADASESEITGTIMAMKQSHDQVGDLSKQVATLTAKLATDDAVTMVNSAMTEGKITPAQKEWALGYAKEKPEEFKVFIAKAPVVVDPGQVNIDTPPDTGGKLDDTTIMVAKQFGNSEEDLKKFGGIQ